MIPAYTENPLILKVIASAQSFNHFHFYQLSTRDYSFESLTPTAGALN